MKKNLACALTLFLLLFGQTVMAKPRVSTQAASKPPVNPEATVLMDAQSGQILYARNQDQHLAIASITKIMTAIIALEKGDLDTEVTVGPEVLDRKRVYGTLILLEPGEKFTRRDLLYALMMNSANDAAVAIAVNIGGSVDDFVHMMNEKAKQLGAVDTHFTNPHGLSEVGHYSSALDMALISRYALQNPVFAEIVRTKERKFPRNKPDLPNKLKNHNKMLWLYDGADGVKTGYTDQAGNTLVTSATRNGRQLIVIELKGSSAGSLYQDAEKMLDYGFTQFTDKLLAQKGQVMESVRFDNGQILKLVPIRDVYGTSPNSVKDGFQLKVKLFNRVLPVNAGEVRGQLDVYYQDKLIQSQPLVALENISLSLPFSPSVKINYLHWSLPVLIIFVLLFTLLCLVRRRRKVTGRNI